MLKIIMIKGRYDEEISQFQKSVVFTTIIKIEMGCIGVLLTALK